MAEWFCFISSSPSLLEASNADSSSNEQCLQSNDEEAEGSLPSPATPSTTSESYRSAPSPSSSTSSNSVSERRDMLDSKLTNYRKEKLKRKLSAEVQMLNYAQEDIHLKKQLMDKMNNMEKEYAENTKRLSSQIERLTSSLSSDGFSVLKNLIPPPPAQPQQLYQMPQCSLDSGNYTGTYQNISSNTPWSTPLSTSSYPNSQLSHRDLFVPDQSENN